jgi:hypothetical protein
MSSPANYTFDAFVAFLQQDDARDTLLALVNDPNFMGLNVAPPVLAAQKRTAPKNLASVNAAPAPAPSPSLPKAPGAPDLSETFTGPDNSDIPGPAQACPVLSDSSDDMIWDDWTEESVPKYQKDAEQYPVIPLDQSFTEGPYRAAIEYELHKMRKQEKREMNGNRKRRLVADAEESDDKQLQHARKRAKMVSSAKTPATARVIPEVTFLSKASSSKNPDDERQEAAKILLQISRGAALRHVEPNHGTPALFQASEYRVEDETEEPRHARIKFTSRQIGEPASKPTHRTTQGPSHSNTPVEAPERNGNGSAQDFEIEQQPWQPPPEVKNQKLNERITLHPSKKKLAAISPPKTGVYLFAVTQTQAPWKRKAELKVLHRDTTETTTGRKRKSSRELVEPTRRSKRLKKDAEPDHKR